MAPTDLVDLQPQHTWRRAYLRWNFANMSCALPAATAFDAALSRQRRKTQRSLSGRPTDSGFSGIYETFVCSMQLFSEALLIFQPVNVEVS